MMIYAFAALMLLSEPAQDSPTDTLEEAYSAGDGTVELCGFSANNFSDFLSQLESDADFVEENSTADYRVYNNGTGRIFRQLVIATPRQTAYPMAYCREVSPKLDGGSEFTSSMQCQGDKKDCDAIFVLFQEHDKKIIASMGS